MPIKKRLTPEQRAKKLITPQHRAALRHPLLKKLCYGGAFDPTPVNLLDAIGMVKSWKGASWTQKVFVQALDIIMEKAFDVAVLDPDTYNRLQEHIISNESKLQAANWQAHQTWLWDIYHDYYKLQDMEPGDLNLPKPLRTKRRPVKAKPTVKRRKLSKRKV